MRPRLSRPSGALALALALIAPDWASSAEVVKYYHLDAIGNVRVVSDRNGAELERFDYHPFGEDIVPPSTPTHLRFTGKERDAETGLDYFGARYYWSKTARFTSIDPVYTWEENLVDPQRWNRYAYGRSNPLRYVDPDGKAISPVVPLMSPAALVPDARGPRVDLAIGIVTGVLTALIPGLHAPAASDLQATGQTIGQASTWGLGFLAVRSAAPKGIQANKAAGDAWEHAVGLELKATHEIAVPRITVRTQGGTKTQLDWVTLDKGQYGCVECKASATAPFTANQAAAFPEIAGTGGTVVGRGKPGIPGGTVIPPTKVEVRRPE